MAPVNRTDASGSMERGPKNKAIKLQAARTVPDASRHNNQAVRSATPVGVKSILKVAKTLPGGVAVEGFAEARSREIVTLKNWMVNSAGAATTRAFQSLPRHLRRRAASHNPRRVPKRIRDKAAAEIDANDIIAKKQKKRAAKRLRGRKGLKVTDIFRRRQRDKTWLETHIWHAKRFHLANLWRYRLALSPTLKSHRPAHRAVHRAATIHDASYFGTIELQGVRSDLIDVLKTMSGGDGAWAGSKFENGGRMATFTLFHSGSWPRGMIGPLELFWQPIPEPESSSTSSPRRTVWLRLHPAIFEEAYDAIKASIANHVVQRATAQDVVQMRDLRGEINAFEIMGPNAARVLRGVMTLCKGEKSAKRQFWDELLSLETAGSVPRGLVASLRVYDPRLSFPPKNVHRQMKADSQPTQTSQFDSQPSSELAAGELWTEEVRDKLFKPRYRKSDLDARRAALGLPGVKLRAIAQDDRIPIVLYQRSVDSAVASTGIHGFTLLVPAGWGMPFWQSLVFTGSFIIGLKERTTQYHEAGLPSLPVDFAGFTSAGDDWAMKKQAELRQRWERRPPGKRAEWLSLGTRSPWIADWMTVLASSHGKDVGEGAASTASPWLVTAPLLRQLDSLMGAIDQPARLLAAINAFRAKRGLPLLDRAETMLHSALVDVRIEMVGKGSPDDLSIIYRVSEEERVQWMEAEEARKAGREETNRYGFEQSVKTAVEVMGEQPASQHDIVGYVTSGNFSLARGTGHGIGAVSLTAYLELSRIGQKSTSAVGQAIVKVRNRDAPTYRLATLSLIE